MDEVDPNEPSGFWMSWIVGPPLMLFYLLAPYAIAFAGICVAMAGTMSVISSVRHFF